MDNNYVPLPIAKIIAVGLPCRTCALNTQRGDGVFRVASEPCPDCTGTGKRIYPQDQPGAYWVRDKEEDEPWVELLDDNYFYPDHLYMLQIASPPVLTYDGNGLLPWLLCEVLNWECVGRFMELSPWVAFPFGDESREVQADTPLALIYAVFAAEGIEVDNG